MAALHVEYIRVVAGRLSLQMTASSSWQEPWLEASQGHNTPDASSQQRHWPQLRSNTAKKKLFNLDWQSINSNMMQGAEYSKSTAQLLSWTCCADSIRAGTHIITAL